MRILFIAVLMLTFTVGDASSQLPSKLTVEQQQQLEECKRLIQEVDQLLKAGKFKDAMVLSKKVLRIERSILGDDHPNVLAMTTWFVGLQEQLCDFEAAKVTWADLYARKLKLLGENHWQTIDARLGLKNAERMAALGPDQRALLEEEKKLFGQTIAMKSMGKWADLIVVAEKILAIRKVLHGVNHHAYADVLNDLGLYYDLQGFPSKALPLFLEALRIRREVLGEKHPLYATTLGNIASLYEARGEYAKAEQIVLESLRIRREVLGENHPEYAMNLNNLAMVYEAQGHYAKAEPLILDALNILKATQGGKHPFFATVLNNMAGLYSSQGIYDKAEGIYREALGEIKEKLGEKHPTYAVCLNNLANVYIQRNLYAEAEPLFLESAKVRKEALGEKHPSFATSLNNLAAVYVSLGRFANAEQYYLESLRLRKETLGETHPRCATSMMNLASLYLNQKQFDQAEPLFRESLRINEDRLGEQHPDTAGSLNYLAVLYAARAQPAKAEPLFKRALRILQIHLQETSAIQSEGDQLRHSAVSRTYLDNYLLLPDADVTSLYEFVFRWRGAVTARQTFARVARRSSPETRGTIEMLQDVARQMNRLTQNPPASLPKDELAKQVRALDQQREALQKKLAGTSADFAEYQQHLTLTPTDLQKSLPDDTALIDFLVHGDSISVFIVTKTAIHRVVLNGVNDLKDELALFLGDLSLDRTRPVTHKGDVSAKLRRRIWEPLEEHLTGISRVLICPDGPLCRLPFAALPGKDPKKYLLEELSIVIVPVPQLLTGLLNAEANEAAPQSLLAVGDVHFDGSPARIADTKVALPSPTRAGKGLSWSRLPHTKAEIDEIETLFGKQPGAKVKRLFGNEATEAAIETELPKHRYIHLATHGFFAPPKFVRQLKDGQLLGDEKALVPVLPPGLSSGIVCAGANKPTFQSSGILTATQITELDLRNVELVVLSACETGLGELAEAGGEGVLGLQRAFQIAGARSTITSLWAIPDQATAELMKRMYANRLEKGLPSAEALREAQLWVLNNGDKVGAFDEPQRPGKRTPPKFWAAFTLAGDWR